jgi:hypothetical protein
MAMPMFKSAIKRIKTPLLAPFRGAVRKPLRTSRKPATDLAQRLRTLSTLAVLLVGCLWPEGGEASSSMRFQFAFAGDRAVVMHQDGDTWKHFASASDTGTFKRIPPAPGMYLPLRLVSGFAGHVYVQDAAQPRLCLYDTAGQWLSCRALPEPLLNRRPDRVGVVARRDGRFVFVDQDQGKASLWREARESEGKSSWQHLATVTVPVGLEACIERPWFDGLCCLRQGKPLCYDAFLNALSTPLTSSDSALRAYPSGRHWRFRVGPPHLGLNPSSRPSWHCFEPRHGFNSCPPVDTGP